MTQPKNIALPDVVKLVMPAQHAVQILQALGDLPFKIAQPISMNLEQQLIAQQVFPQPEAASASEASAQPPIDIDDAAPIEDRIIEAA